MKTIVPAESTPSFSGRSGEMEEELVSPLAFLMVLLRRWRVVTALPVALVLLVVVFTLLQRPIFTATTSFLPQAAQSTQSQISNLAAQFGFDVGSVAGSAQSPALYRTLLQSDEILRGIAGSDYDLQIDGKTTPQRLPGLLETDDENRAVESEKTVRAVRDMSTIAIDRETGLVQVEFRSEWPTLSLQVIHRMLQSVNQFNLRKRQEQAAAEQAFVQSRLDYSRGQLRAAEDELQAFLQRNRQYQGDPTLLFAYDRLRRDVEMRQVVYTTLAQAYEHASLNALRETPSIVVVQQPEVAATPDRRRMVLRVVLALLIGSFLAVLLAFTLDYFQRLHSRSPVEYAEFRALQKTVKEQLKRPFHPISRK